MSRGLRVLTRGDKREEKEGGSPPSFSSIVDASRACYTGAMTTNQQREFSTERGRLLAEIEAFIRGPEPKIVVPIGDRRSSGRLLAEAESFIQEQRQITPAGDPSLYAGVMPMRKRKKAIWQRPAWNRDVACLRAMAQLDRPCTSGEILELVGGSKIAQTLRRLHADGLVSHNGRRGLFSRWEITDKGREEVARLERELEERRQALREGLPQPQSSLAPKLESFPRTQENLKNLSFTPPNPPASGGEPAARRSTKAARGRPPRTYRERDGISEPTPAFRTVRGELYLDTLLLPSALTPAWRRYEWFRRKRQSRRSPSSPQRKTGAEKRSQPDDKADEDPSAPRQCRRRWRSYPGYKRRYRCQKRRWRAFEKICQETMMRYRAKDLLACQEWLETLAKGRYRRSELIKCLWQILDQYELELRQEGREPPLDMDAELLAEMKRRAKKYHWIMGDAVLTPRALAKWWMDLVEPERLKSYRWRERNIPGFKSPIPLGPSIADIVREKNRREDERVRARRGTSHLPAQGEEIDREGIRRIGELMEKIGRRIDEPAMMNRAGVCEKPTHRERAVLTERPIDVERAAEGERPASLERAERPKVASAERAIHRERPAYPERAVYRKRPIDEERASSAERPTGVERAKPRERPTGVEQAGHGERPNTTERAERTEKSNGMERAAGLERPNVAERADSTEIPTDAERAIFLGSPIDLERASRDERPNHEERAEGCEGPAVSERIPDWVYEWMKKKGWNVGANS